MNHTNITGSREYITTNDGVRLFYKDWGQGQPVLFLSGWALTADMWSYQMLRLKAAGRRCIAYDRRGHGRSADPGCGYNYDVLANDLASVIAQLDLQQVTLVGHSMAGGEMIRYLSLYGTARIARMVMVAPTTPLPCLDIDTSVMQVVERHVSNDFPGYLAANEQPFVLPSTSPDMTCWIKGMMLQCSLLAAIECNAAMFSTDFRTELPHINTPALVVHGDADASAPLLLTGARTAALLPNSRLKVYPGAPHGLFITHIEQLHGDIMDFCGEG
jgi:pimeloyl-ACP methyl ester carboxylesterase